jgi:hypothetical protein
LGGASDSYEGEEKYIRDFDWETWRKMTTWRSRRMWKDNIKMDLEVKDGRRGQISSRWGQWHLLTL